MNDFQRRLTILSLIPRQPDQADISKPAATDGSYLSNFRFEEENIQAECPLPIDNYHRGKISASELLEKLQALGFQGNLRAIQRDLVFLKGLFPDLLSDGVRSGGQGWFWHKDAPVLNLPALDPAMALAFVLSRDLLKPLLPPILVERLEPFFSVAEKVLREAGTPKLAEWKDRVRVIPEGQPLLHAEIDSKVMGIIQTALMDGVRFKGRYQPQQRDMAEYEFNPLGLIYRDRVVYLVATLWNYSDPRHFALHRFLWVESTDTSVTLPDGFELDTYIASGTFQYPAENPEPILLMVRMKADAASHLHETPLSTDQVITVDSKDPEWKFINATVLETDQLYWWLLGFGAQVEVLEPEHLRKSMMANVQDLIHRYGI